jgi:hypothetical protein
MNTIKTEIIKNRIENFLSRHFLFKEDLFSEGKPTVGVGALLRSSELHLFKEFQGGYYMSFGQLRKLLGVSNLEKPVASLWNKFYRDTVLTEYCEVFRDEASPRIKAAEAMGITSYLQYTSSIKLYPPQAVEHILLSPISRNTPNNLGTPYTQHVMAEFMGVLEKYPEQVIAQAQLVSR